MSFVDEWDRSHTTELALFDPEIRLFVLSFDPKYGRSQKKEISPLEEAIQDYKAEENDRIQNDSVSTRQENPDVPNTKLISDLNETVMRALIDFNQASELHYSEDAVEQQFLEEKRQVFFSGGIRLHATVLTTLFDRLVSQDKYNPEFFSNYKEIRRLIDVTTGMTSALHLRELIMIAESVIPISVREQEHEIIENNNSYSANVDEG